MEELRAYLASLTPDEQSAFAKRCGTSIGYLRKALCTKPRFGESLAIALDRESGGAVPCEKIRDDVDWANFRRVLGSTATPSKNASCRRA